MIITRRIEIFVCESDKGLRKEYYEKLYRESKAKYEESQRKYASFHDSNLDATLGTITTKRDELENEMQLRYNIFNQVSTQLQSAQSKVQERTPVFTIIQKPRVPNKASSMPRMFTKYSKICRTIL